MAEHPHDLPDNGAGGEAGTHDGHADAVPSTSTFGRGFATYDEEGPGNAAAQQAKREKFDSGRNGASPPGSGLYPTPVNQ